MLLASVPQLHRKWADVAAELEAPGPEAVEAGEAADAGIALDKGPVTLVEVEDDHLVASV